MHWGKPYFLLLLIIIPLMLIFVAIGKQRHKKRFSSFAENRFYAFFMQKFSFFYWNLKQILFIIALFFLIIALALPQWGQELQIVKKEGIDIVVCIDVSKSMDAQDIRPSRIERAKDQISLFIDQLRGDRIGLVAFAGRSFVQSPLTDDYAAAKLFLSILDTEAVPSYGTNIGNAIEKAMSLFSDDQTHKVIVLISDGEDLEEKGIKVGEEAVKKGAIIYTLGVGSPEGSTIPLKDDKGNTIYAKDDEGNIVFSKLDITTLTQISRVGNGRFFPITPTQSEIYEVMKNINSIEKKKFDSRQFTRYQERYYYFVIIGLFFLILEYALLYKKKKPLERTIQ
jgi:Ca-activated chloride channel family protein